MLQLLVCLYLSIIYPHDSNAQPNKGFPAFIKTVLAKYPFKKGSSKILFQILFIVDWVIAVKGILASIL
jgi:hypothetical protein